MLVNTNENNIDLDCVKAIRIAEQVTKIRYIVFLVFKYIHIKYNDMKIITNP